MQWKDFHCSEQASGQAAGEPDSGDNPGWEGVFGSAFNPTLTGTSSGQLTIMPKHLDLGNVQNQEMEAGRK